MSERDTPKEKSSSPCEARHILGRAAQGAEDISLAEPIALPWSKCRRTRKRIYVYADLSHQTLCTLTPASAQNRPAPPPGRAPQRGSATQADPRLRPRWLRQDHAARRMARRSTAAGRLAVAGRRGQRPRALSGLPRRRSATDRRGYWGRRVGCAPVCPAAADRIGPDGPAQRDQHPP